MELREPKLGVAVGRKGCGKTFTTREMIKGYVLGNPSKGVAPRRALILDVNDEFEDVKALKLSDVIRFSRHPHIEARRIRPFNTNGVRMTLNEVQEALFRVLNDYRGGLLLIEDINRYVSDSLPNDLVGAICTNRHTDTDIILHFQSIGRISPKIWQNVNWIRYHKNTDSVIRHRNKFEDKYEMLQIAENYINEKYNSGDKRVYCFIDIDDEKIRRFNKDIMDKAITMFISDNASKLVVPLTKRQEFGSTKPKPTLEEAYRKVKARIITDYLDE